MLPVGFEPTISAGERPPTYALDSYSVRNTNFTKDYIYLYTRMRRKLKKNKLFLIFNFFGFLSVQYPNYISVFQLIALN